MATSSQYESMLESALGSVMAQLGQHTTEELTEMVSGDEDKLNAIIMELPQMKAMVTEREMLLAQNKSLAEWNLSQEPRLRDAKQKLVDTFEKAKAQQTEALEKKAKLDSFADQRSLDTTQVLLETAARESEEETEAMVERMLEGDMSIDDFLSQFKEKRALGHLRKVKSEQLKEILRNQQFGGGSQNRDTSPYGNKRRAPPPPPQQAYPWNYTM